MWPTIASFWIFLVLGSQACSPQRDVVRLTCPNDIYLVADKNSATAAVAWDATDFSVTSKNQIKGLYQIVPVHGASATFRRTFPEGTHYVEYKAVDSSGNHGDCSFTVTVKVVQCPELYNPQFGVVTCDSGNLYGSRCSISCSPGYVAVGLESICQADGRWSYDVAYCRMTTCSDPGTPFDGTRKCTTSTHAYDSACEFNCRHGYQLLGNRRIVCQSVDNRTQWSNAAPMCQEIIPPTPENCPSSVRHVTDVGQDAVVHLPPISFRTYSGADAPFVCSHFGRQERSRTFSIGRHIVTCTATDPLFGDRATARCTFSIIVEANPCRPLAQPINGFLFCGGSSGGGEFAQRTICRMKCNRSYVLPPTANFSEFIDFKCGPNGTWYPSTFVPSCVVPNRPVELKLQAEIRFRSSDCSNEIHQKEVDDKFRSALLTVIRNHSAFALNPKDCIIDEVIPNCSPTSRRRRRHHNNPPEVRRDISSDVTGSRRASVGRRRSRSARRHVTTELPFNLTIEFRFATRLPSVGGNWPDEYHWARQRLDSLFYYFKQEVNRGVFTMRDRVESLTLKEVNDSVTLKYLKPICDIGYVFNNKFLLCVPCGAGTFFNTDLEQCEQCPEGTTQRLHGQIKCHRHTSHS